LRTLLSTEDVQNLAVLASAARCLNNWQSPAGCAAQAGERMLYFCAWK
jgi:hypothetical protein